MEKKLFWRDVVCVDIGMLKFYFLYNKSDIQ